MRGLFNTGGRNLDLATKLLTKGYRPLVKLWLREGLDMTSWEDRLLGLDGHLLCVAIHTPALVDDFGEELVQFIQDVFESTAVFVHVLAIILLYFIS